mgnify:CR=1 FL=1
MGHMALRVRDLDASVAFQAEVLGMVETERRAGASYMTCNERHHELILIEDPVDQGYDHIALEVESDSDLEMIGNRVVHAGGTRLGPVYDGEPGIGRALKVASPEGHVFKLFHGMETGAEPPPGDRPVKFEHASVKVKRPKGFERFIEHGLGFSFSDRMGKMASWWHCDADHHGMAAVWAPKVELSHYAYAWEDFNALGRVADRLKNLRDSHLVWGPSRHGPGNNHFAYLLDQDGAMVENCSELAKMPPEGDYIAREWPVTPKSINQWGGPPPLKFIKAGFPVARPVEGRPAWAMDPDRTPGE